MAMIDSASEQQHEESDSLEKGNVQGKSGLHVEDSLRSRDSGLIAAGVPHEDDPLVCFRNNYFRDALLIDSQHWNRLYKLYIVGLVSLLGFVGQSKHLLLLLLHCHIDFVKQ
jgi:hypothetical protein